MTNKSEYYKLWRSRNPEKVRESGRKSEEKWRQNNPQKAKDVGDRFRAKRRQLINEIKSRPCMDCGKQFPPECMDFDHVRGEKVGGIYQLYTRNMELLMEEIDKCDLVCANCHRTRTCKRKPPRWKLEEMENGEDPRV